MILLTGFEPFGGDTFNPSRAIAFRAAEMLAERSIPARAAELPCVFALAPERLNELVDEHEPDVVISLGLAAGRDALSLEKVAINHVDARIPDNAGEQPIDRQVLPGGANAYFSTLPLKGALRALRNGPTEPRRGQAGSHVRAEISYSAGTFVCNQVFYALMHRLDGNPGARGGFIHVPWLEANDPRIEHHARAVADIAVLALGTEPEPVFSAGRES